MSITLDRNPFLVASTIFQAGLIFGLSVFVFNQGFSQTPQQLQQLNSIPANQRDALMQQLGIGAQQQLGQAQEPLNFPDVVNESSFGDASGDLLEQQQPLVPRLAPGDTLVIEFVPKGEGWVPPTRTFSQLDPPQQAFAATAGVASPISPDELGSIDDGFLFSPEARRADSAIESLRREEMLKRLVISNPYELDRNGFLNLPGVPPIRLAGLNVEEAMIRVRAEPSIVWLQPVLTFLPLEPFGLAALEPFGYDLFRGVPTTFAPATDVPVPAEYVMGPGDTINVLLFGNTNAQYQMVISREGAINFPEIGPISVAGLTFEELKTVISQQVEEQMIGVRTSITLGELRSIRVFVLGDVQQPGSYTVSGLSTMTNALFVSGGVNDVGSLRKIELRRGNDVVTTLDLYDLLLRGDTSGDERLQPGDVMFAPPIGDSVSVYGDVRRPGIYELNGEVSVEQIVSLAGGFTSDADPGRITLERNMPNGTAVYNINSAWQIEGIRSLEDGDVLLVQSRLEQLDEAVRLSGNVFQPGIYPWREGLRLTELIDSRSLVRPGSDLGYVLIKREIEANVDTEVFSTNLRSAWANPGGDQDVLLQSRDTVYVFDQLNSRQRVIPELLNELKEQAYMDQAAPVVHIGGQVNSPGEYPLESGMRISDLLRAGGGLSDSAYTVEAELMRYTYSVYESPVRQTSIVSVNIDNAMQNNEEANVLLSPYDYLNIKVVSNWENNVRSVELVGEVIFPGVYPLVEGETLHDVLQRAGGMTDFAFPAGSLFIRQNLIETEAQQLEQLANRLESDMAAISMNPENAATTTAAAALVGRLRNTEPVGRLVIDLQAILDGTNTQEIILRDGDQLYVPPQAQEVTVIGEVQYATSHIYDETLDRDAYILLSGGATEHSDIDRIYTVGASGAVNLERNSNWFVGRNGSSISPGDTIVVPSDTSVPLIPVWAAATQVVYNIAIAAAALQSF
ncbi:MAG: SLBB domain-containing protein [Candidatus Rariloculaceae bacterium]